MEKINNEICPFCLGKECQRVPIADGDWSDDMDGGYWECENIDIKGTIHSSIYYGTNEEIIKRLHTIYLYLLNTKDKNLNGYRLKYKFFYVEDMVGKTISDPFKINVATLLRSYPKTFMEKMESILMNLAKRFPDFKCIDSFNLHELYHLVYCNSDSVLDVNYILDFLVELGYLKIDNKSYIISAEGWKKVSEIEHNKSVNQGFIAMAFKEETQTIGETFKNSIDACGYVPRRIDEKEHNNQIVPEILYEISKSKFVVVDVTYPNYGAYYEAGYAEALGKQVIICCREDAFNDKENKPHFDIAQKSTIVWKDEEDLGERLRKRIEATVGCI